ncbi:hypothetical protein BKA70DRAFT_597495 [Coprinopsis sp. MPI-PUGE-AT-0042]|nr:hypothetical protein BKA70DRAFT_597495 [Coprinopsis sp. MPI-PUGE-AT-0042]
MDASDLNDILASLNPRWDPFMAINTSETCAATRLHQCREMGTQMNDITRKFAGPYDKNRVPDISKIDFSIRRKLIDQVAQWSAELQQKARVSRKFEYEWTPILYMYEVVKTAAKKERDWGHMIFIDSTTTRIFLVMVFPNPCDCGNFSHHDYDALTKYHADRFMSLMKYVYHTDNEPKWIRATYVTPKEQFTLPTEFFKHGSASSTDPTSSNVEKIDGKPPIITVLANDFVPSLLGSEVEKIDNLFARGRDSSKPERSQALKNQVTGEKETRPQVSKTWQSKQPRECSNCHTAKETGMMICSRCKLAHYCGKECQKEAWPRHKPLCKKV